MLSAFKAMLSTTSLCNQISANLTDMMTFADGSVWTETASISGCGPFAMKVGEGMCFAVKQGFDTIFHEITVNSIIEQTVEITDIDIKQLMAVLLVAVPTFLAWKYPRQRNMLPIALPEVPQEPAGAVENHRDIYWWNQYDLKKPSI